MYANLGKLLLQSNYSIGQQQTGGRRHRRDCYNSAHSRFLVARKARDGLRAYKQLLHGGQKPRSILAQSAVPLVPVKQCYAQRCFQLLNLHGKGGLRNVKHRSGPRKIAGPGNGDERTDLAKILNHSDLRIMFRQLSSSIIGSRGGRRQFRQPDRPPRRPSKVAGTALPDRARSCRRSNGRSASANAIGAIPRVYCA